MAEDRDPATSNLRARAIRAEGLAITCRKATNNLLGEPSCRYLLRLVTFSRPQTHWPVGRLIALVPLAELLATTNPSLVRSGPSLIDKKPQPGRGVEVEFWKWLHPTTARTCSIPTLAMLHTCML